MQQRQLRLGDILDDYCPRERRVTNHAIVAMIGEDVKQTRCTTCDADHEYKHAKVPRQRRKTETPAALYSQVLANGPKRVAHEGAPTNGAAHAKKTDDAPPAVDTSALDTSVVDAPIAEVFEEEDQQIPPPADSHLSASSNGHAAHHDDDIETDVEDEDGDVNGNREEGPVHRPLIRASLPRPDGQQPPPRPIPEFTIRQPGGRPNRFRPRHQGNAGPRGGGQQFQGNRSNGNVAGGSARNMRPGGGRPPHGSHGAAPARLARRNGPGRKRSK
jgi:hypothetical protein